MKTFLFLSLLLTFGCSKNEPLTDSGDGSNDSTGNSQVSVTGVVLDKITLILNVGTIDTLKATIAPTNAGNKNITWTSDNANTATVSNGVVTAVAAGTAKITVTTQDGNKTATCTVTVNSSISLATGTNTNQTVYAGDTLATVSFITKGPWASSIISGTAGAASWITVSPGYGNTAGTYTPAINLQPNTTGADRSATINFTCNGATITINITQKATNEDGTPYISNIPKSGDVYVAGKFGNDAIIWKNGLLQYLVKDPYSATTDVTIANSVYISGSDVYVAGQSYDPYANGQYSNSYSAIFWKNEVVQGLSGNIANSVFVSGGDVYVAGVSNSSNIATLWKNGNPQSFYGSNAGEMANSVYVSDNDVYVVCSVPSYPEQSIAGLWKNGNRILLLSDYRIGGTALYWGTFAYSVFVSGSDVYVAGGCEYMDTKDNNYHEAAILWKNNIEQSLTDGSSNALAYSVYVNGSDVYVAGNNGNYAALWKNGVAQYLTNGTNLAKATSVFVSNDNVYVAGYDGNRAVLWKNNVAQYLSDGTTKAVANSVFVVQ